MKRVSLVHPIDDSDFVIQGPPAEAQTGAVRHPTKDLTPCDWVRA